MRLRVLIVEPNPEDLLFLNSALTEMGEAGPAPGGHWIEVQAEHACSLKEATAVLSKIPIDATLLNLTLADSRGAETYRRVQALAPRMPVVLLASPSERSLAIHLIREGAQDFLMKGQIDCGPLRQALETAVERHRFLSATRASAMTDPLTGLLNRSGFLTMGARDRALAARLGLRAILIAAESARFAHNQDLTLVEAADHLRSLAGSAGLIGLMADARFALFLLESPAESVDAAWARVTTATDPTALRLGRAIYETANPASLEALHEQAETDLVARAAPRIPPQKAAAAR